MSFVTKDQISKKLVEKVFVSQCKPDLEEDVLLAFVNNPHVAKIIKRKDWTMPVDDVMFHKLMMSCKPYISHW